MKKVSGVKKKIGVLVQSWSNNNLFGNDIADSIFQVILYIAFPIAVTVNGIPNKNTAANRAYFYLTIIISALNCLYDAWSRSKVKKNKVKDTKLILLGGPIIGVCMYCVIQVLQVLAVGPKASYPDLWLCMYFVSVAIVACDFFSIVFHKLEFVDEKLVEEEFAVTSQKEGN